MTGGDSLTRLRPWNALAVALLVLYLGRAGPVLLRRPDDHPGPSRVRDHAVRRSPPTATRGPGGRWRCRWRSALAAFAAYYVPRRHETRSFSLLITGGLGVSTIVLGVVGRVELHPEPESPFFAPLAIALALLLGSAPTFTGGLRERRLPAGRAGRPAVRAAAAGDHGAGHRGHPVPGPAGPAGGPVLPVVGGLVGLSEEALPLIRRLADDLPRRTVLAVLVADASIR